jgi:geranylgeranyl reductase family protein
MQAPVAIIGAGPAGAAAAVRLGQLGVRDVLLVDRARFPRDKTCGSGISPKGIRTLRALGVWDRIAPHAYPVRGLRLVTPGGREVTAFGREATDAVICLRRTLDGALVDAARALGVTFVPELPVTRLLHEGGRVAGFAARDGREVRARYTVVAAGTHSSFGLEAGLDGPPPRLLQALMGWWDGVPFTPHAVEMVFDPMVAPGYGWLFPESATRVNIGICYEDPDRRVHARRLFERFLAKHYAGRLARATPVGRWRGHPVAYGFRVRRLTSAGRVVVGEAGRLVHPATAEGIYQAVRSGILAAEALAGILRDGVDERTALGAYEARCRRAFQVSFRAARLWRGMLGTPVLDWAVAAAGRPRLRRAIGRVMAAM